MSLPRVALVGGLAAVALTGCGSTTAPPAGRGRVDTPQTAYSNRVSCLRDAGLAVATATVARLPGLQIGAAPAGPSVAFASTPGAAQSEQINAQAEGAETIGSALLYPNQGSDAELKTIETCLAKGVTG